MSKGHKRDEFKTKKGESHHKKGQGRGHPAEDPIEKRPSVFDRLGTKGSASAGKAKILGTDRTSVQKLSRGGKKEKHRNRKYKAPKASRRRKEIPRSSDESSSDEASSSSTQSSSTTESSTSSTAATTTSSSSVPSVKIRTHRKRLENNSIEKDFRKEHKKHAIEKDRKQESDEDRNSQFEKPRSQGMRTESATKRKAPPDSRQQDGWKQPRYDMQPNKPPLLRHNSPRRRTPPVETYQKGRGMGMRNREGSEPERDRIRIVPPAYVTGSGRPLPLDVSQRYSSPKPNSRPDNRNFQDFRNVDEKRQRERLAPARTPTRNDRIPPLLPEIELRRASKFSNRDGHRGFNNFHRPPQPLLPERRDRELSVMSPPHKFLVPKLEDSVVKSRVDEWVGETISPLKRVKVEETVAPPQTAAPPLPPVEEVLSEISDFEEDSPVTSPVPPSEKEELEVSSTLVDETVTSGGVEGLTGGESHRDDSILEDMDFEEISEDEFEDGCGHNAKLGIVDALGVDWSVLLRGKEELSDTASAQPTSRHRESSVVEILKRTGLPRSLVSETLFSKVLNRLQDIEITSGLPAEAQTKAEELEKPCLRRRRFQQNDLVESLGLGPASRALSLRRDLEIRHHLLGFDRLPLESFDTKPPVALQLKTAQ